MRIFFILGWVLLAASFVAAAAETTAKIATRASGAFLPAADLWRNYFPNAFASFRDGAEGIHPVLWEPLLSTVLLLPAWLLLSIPGALLAWFCRPSRNHPIDEDGEMSPSSLYDDLAKAAKEEGFDSKVDDMAPNTRSFDWAKNDPAQAQARRTPHEDMGEEAQRFADELAKRAQLDGYIARDREERRAPDAKPGLVRPSQRPTAIPPTGGVAPPKRQMPKTPFDK
jgi:hypothetical protein